MPCGACEGSRSKAVIKKPLPVTGGVLRLEHGALFEFFASGMGAVIRLGMRHELVRFHPQHACVPFIGTEEQVREASGRAVLIFRGRCPFSLKLEHARLLGASMVVFANSDTSPIAVAEALDNEKNPSSESFVQGTLLPSIAVYHRAGKQLSNLLDSTSRLEFSLNASELDISDVEGLFDMYDMDQWHSEPKNRLEQLKKLLPEKHSTTGEREAEAQRLFELAELHYSL